MPYRETEDMSLNEMLFHLRELQKLGLVEQIADGKWKVGPDATEEYAKDSENLLSERLRFVDPYNKEPI